MTHIEKMRLQAALQALSGAHVAQLAWEPNPCLQLNLRVLWQSEPRAQNERHV